jgi:hypothetical protein
VPFCFADPLADTGRGGEEEGMGARDSGIVVESDDPGVAVVTLLGEHDMRTADEVRESIGSACAGDDLLLWT